MMVNVKSFLKSSSRSLLIFLMPLSPYFSWVSTCFNYLFSSEQCCCHRPAALPAPTAASGHAAVTPSGLWHRGRGRRGRQKGHAALVLSCHGNIWNWDELGNLWKFVWIIINRVNRFHCFICSLMMSDAYACFWGVPVFMVSNPTDILSILRWGNVALLLGCCCLMLVALLSRGWPRTISDPSGPPIFRSIVRHERRSPWTQK